MKTVILMLPQNLFKIIFQDFYISSFSYQFCRKYNLNSVNESSNQVYFYCSNLQKYKGSFIYKKFMIIF